MRQPRVGAPPLGVPPGRDPWRRRPWVTCGQQGAWLPWTWRALDPGALASPYHLSIGRGQATVNAAAWARGPPTGPCHCRGSSGGRVNLSIIWGGLALLLLPNHLVERQKERLSPHTPRKITASGLGASPPPIVQVC